MPGSKKNKQGNKISEAAEPNKVKLYWQDFYFFEQLVKDAGISMLF